MGKPIVIPDEDLKQQLLSVAQCIDDPCIVLDGELLIDSDDQGNALDRKTGNGILNKAVRQTMTPDRAARVTCMVWDVIPMDVFTQHGKSHRYINRFNALHQSLQHTIHSRVFGVPTWFVDNKRQIIQVFNQILSQGKEGVIVKSYDNIWGDKRATDQIKLKQRCDVDLRIVDIVRGTGRFAGQLGALVCQSDDRNIVVNVGTGFTEDQRVEMWDKSIIGKVVTVTYNMLIQDKNRPDVYSLFLPRFIEIREDKQTTNTINDVL